MGIARFPSLGGFSVRSIFTFALAVLMTVLLWVLFNGSPAHAADASWHGASIQYDGNQYISVGKAQAGKTHGIAVDSEVYAYLEPAQSAGTATTTQKAHVIYFAPGADPPTTASATYVTYDYDTTTKIYTNPTGKKTISLDTSTASTQGTSCAVESVGWIVCPVSNFLAQGMDWVFGVLAGFMEVQPVYTNNPKSGLYIAWNVMRAIANIAFIIVFLIIIYSQLTSIQVSNYGIKRLLPRLIIGAIGVNVSFIICAAAIDLSNILGHSLQGMFMGMRDTLITNGTPGDGGQMLSWESITGFVLSGGTAVAALGVGAGAAIAGTGGTILGAIFLLLPALLGLLLAVLVVLLILAARQALIVILTIIAPLAIVAYLLPNTDKWFGKWRSLFLTLLIFFPAFAVVFGGAQLAAAAIIQNASSINIVILGMIVQVAPLVITPLLLKFSGGLIGTIARMANDPNKGLLDRTRKWSGDRAEMHRKRGISGNKLNGDPGTLGKKNVLRRSARYLDQRKRQIGDRTANAETASQTAYENSERYAKHDRNGNLKYDTAQQKAFFEDQKNATHSHHAAHVDQARRTQGSLLYDQSLRAEEMKDRAEASQNATKAFYNNARRDQRLAGGALHASSYALEDSKMKLETTENLKNAYYTEQKHTKGTDLYARAAPLETSKLKVEVANNQYTATIDQLKLNNPSSQISIAASRAQSSKEHMEAAQNQLQAMFDTQRRTVGTELQQSTIRLEESKSVAETAKSKLTTYISTERASVGTSLHSATVRAEDAKLETQVAEMHLTKTIDEYKSGKIVRTGELSTLMNSMVDNVEQLYAESQGSQANQNIQKKNIAEAFTANTQRAEDLIRTARGVDPYGDVRAEATALATLEDITNKARTANEALLEERAVTNNQTPKNYALKLLRDRLGGDTSQSEDLIKAAMEIAGKEAQIPIIREMRMSGNFNQGDLTAMLLRNSGTMKAKGGFDLQNDTDLALASPEQMDASIAGTLGSVAAGQFSDLKNGAFIEYADNMETIIANTNSMSQSTNPDAAVRNKEQKYGNNGIEGIMKTYANLTRALQDPEIVNKLGDNLGPAIRMHWKIHNNPQFHNDAMTVNYAAIDPQDISGLRNL